MSPSATSSSQDQQAQQPPKSVIPTHHRVTEQLTKHWSPFKALRQRYAGMRFEEQRQLHLPQKHKATVPDSTLRVEMNNLEEQADNAKAHELFWKPLSWLDAIRPTPLSLPPSPSCQEPSHRQVQEAHRNQPANRPESNRAETLILYNTPPNGGFLIAHPTLPYPCGRLMIIAFGRPS